MKTEPIKALKGLEAIQLNPIHEIPRDRAEKLIREAFEEGRRNPVVKRLEWKEDKVHKLEKMLTKHVKEILEDAFMAGHAEATRWRSMDDGDSPEYNRKVLVKIYTNPSEYEIDIDEFETNGGGLDWFKKHDNDVDCWRYID